MTKKRVLMAMVGMVAAVGFAQASAEGPLDVLTYKVHTVYAPPGGTPVESLQDGVLVAPSLVDVDHDIATGAAGPDVAVQLTIDAGRATLRVTALPGAPSPMPLLVEGILADPRGGSPLRVAFGYDARAATAPAVYNATIQLVGAQRVTSFGLDVEQAGAGDTLGVIAEVYSEGPGGSRVDPQRGRIDFSPVPSATHFGILQGRDFGTQQSGLDITTETPTKATVVIEDVQGENVVRGDATIDRVPNVMTLILTENDDGRKTWNYQASDRIDLVAFGIRETDAGAITDDFSLRLEDMALSAVLVQDTPTHATFQAESPIGAVAAGSAERRAIAWLGEPAYVYATDQGAGESFAFRILGLRAAEIDTGEPFVVDVTIQPGPFRVLVEDGSRTIDGWIRDLPGHIRLTFSPPQGTIDWEGSAPIGEIEVTATDPEGIAGRATQLHLLVEDVPESLSLAWQQSGGVAKVDAKGGEVGLIELLLTSGPDLAVDPGFDGVVFEDVPDRYTLAARLTGLRFAQVSAGDPPYAVELRKQPGPFLVSLLEGQRSTRIEVLDLPASLTATFDPAGSLTYSGSAPIGEINARIADPAGVSGRATLATALLRDVPSALDVSWSAAGGGTIGADAKGQTVGLLEVLLTSGPDATLPADRDGILLHDLSDRYVVFGRLTGLKKVSFSQGPPPSFKLDTTGGRIFVVDVRTQKPGGIATTAAAINVLPSSIDVRFSGPTALSYSASAPVGSLTIDAFDPEGISGRANTLHGLVQSIPVAFDVSWTSSGTVTLDAKGGTVGLIEIQLTSGPDDRLPAQFDGILLNDLSDRYVIFARVTGLRRLVGTQSPQPDVTFETGGGRILKVELNELDGGKIAYTRVTLDSLPSSVRIRVAGDEMFYTASSRTNSLTIDTNSGDRWNLHADIRNPLPASMSFCAAGNGYCTGFARSAGAGSFKFTASEHASVNVFDCIRPLSSSCVRGSASEYTQVDNWRVRHFEFDADTDDVAFEGYTFNNTNGHSLSGYLKQISGSNGFEANINPGYWSANRKVEWSWWGAEKDKSGSVNCAGSDFSVRVFGIWIGVTSYVC